MHMYIIYVFTLIGARFEYIHQQDLSRRTQSEAVQCKLYCTQLTIIIIERLEMEKQIIEI